MSTTEPFLPRPERDETIAAADPGHGAPAPAAGFGIAGEEPDVAHESRAEDRAAETAPATVLPEDVPFRTPDPDDVRRNP